MSAVSDSGRVKTPPAAVAGRVALAAVAAAAWVVLAIGMAGHTTHDDVLGHGHVAEPAAVAALIGGWLVMVAAMMLPPELVGARWTGAALAAMAAATCAVWTGFAIVAIGGDAVVHELAESSTWLERSIAPAVLIGAGLFQLSPVKRRLLTATQRPSERPWRHAVRCLGSCWALMLVMFAIGVGNLIWMIVLTVVMTAERAGARAGTRAGARAGARAGTRAGAPVGALIAALAGLGLIAVGVLVAVWPDRIV